MDLNQLPIQRWQVKFILPTVGLVAAYGGAAVGLTLVLFPREPLSPLTLLLVPCGVGLIVGFGALVGTRHALRHVAGHANPTRIALFWAVTAVSLYVVDWILQKALDWELSPLIAHIALLSSGILAGWVDEPI